MSKWLYLNTTQKKVIIPSFSVDAAMSFFFFFIVILFTLHSPGSSGWPSCVLEHGEHQTQMGTKSHYFSAGCIMAQVGGNASTFPNHDWAGIKKHQKSDCSTYGKLARCRCQWPEAFLPAPHGRLHTFLFKYKIGCFTFTAQWPDNMLRPRNVQFLGKDLQGLALWHSRGTKTYVEHCYRIFNILYNPKSSLCNCIITWRP